MENQEQMVLRILEERLGPIYQPLSVRAGHDISHIQRMIKFAEKILSKNRPPRQLFLLKVAIWLHNLDRVIKKSQVLDFINNLFSQIGSALSEEEKSLILDAVKKHNLLNDPADSQLLKDLKDVDRADIGAIGVLRAATHWPNIPFYLPGDFERKLDTSEEKICSLMGVFHRILEWEEMIREEEIKKFIKPRFEFIREFIQRLKREVEEIL